MATGVHEAILRLIGDDKSINAMYARQKRMTREFRNEITAAGRGISDVFEQIGVKAKRVGSIGLFRISAGGALGATSALIAGAQAARELAGALEVTGIKAASAEGRLRNAGSSLLSGNVVGAFKALGAEAQFSSSELQNLAESGASINDLGRAKAEAAAAGFAAFAKQLDAVQKSMIAVNAANAQFNVNTGGRPDEGTRGAAVSQPATILPDLFAGLSPRAREALADAQIAAKGATDKVLLDALRLQERELKRQLPGATPRERVEIKEALAGVTGAINGYYDAVNAAAKTAAAQAKADADAARAKAIQDAEDAARRRRALLEARIDARNARQFVALGLTREGDERAPSAAHLRASIKDLRQDFAGDLTPKQSRRLEQIRKVLVGQLGVVGRDVRLAAQDVIDGIRDTLEQDIDTKGPLTKTTALNANAIIRNVRGLDPSQVRQLRAQLSGFNSAGVRLAAKRGTVGAFGVASAAAHAGVQVTVELDGRSIEKNVTVRQQSTGKRNPPQRSGAHR